MSLAGADRSTSLKNMCCGNDKGRESLEKGIVSRDLADAHEEVLKSGDVDIHDLRDQVTNGIFLAMNQYTILR